MVLVRADMRKNYNKPATHKRAAGFFFNLNSSVLSNACLQQVVQDSHSGVRECEYLNLAVRH